MSDPGHRGGYNPHRSPDGTFATSGLGDGSGHAAMNAAIRTATGRCAEEAAPGFAAAAPLRDDTGRLVPRVRATQASSPATLAEVDQRPALSVALSGVERDNLNRMGVAASLRQGQRYAQALGALLARSADNQGVVNTVQRVLASNGYAADPTSTLRDMRQLFDAAGEPSIADDIRDRRGAYGATIAIQLKRPEIAAGLLAGVGSIGWDAARASLDALIAALNGFA